MVYPDPSHLEGHCCMEGGGGSISPRAIPIILQIGQIRYHVKITNEVTVCLNILIVWGRFVDEMYQWCIMTPAKREGCNNSVMGGGWSY